MNKRLLVGMFTALMAMVPLSGYADQTIDAPHINVDSNGGTEDCTYCHFANYQPSDCVRCHSNNNAPYGDGTAPLVATHQTLDCQACHNPHVSLQATGVAGAYTGIQANTPSAGMTTLTGVTPTPETSWKEKTTASRGMILWIPLSNDAQGNPQAASYEVEGIDAVAGTVTVKGDVTVASGNFDLRRGQLIAKKVTKTAASSYRQGDLPVQFPSASGNTSIFIDTQNGSTPKGVCQVCHTATQYWKNDGTAVTHNADKPCTQCHKHAAGFMVTGCTACHPGADPDGAPRTLAELALPSTGSQTAGMHEIHATTAGYNFNCETCHKDTGMPQGSTNVVKGDGIQIGFSWGKFLGYLTSYNGQSTVDGVGTHSTYAPTNHTSVTNTGAVGNGSLTCSNVYCHSDGTAIRRNCATSTLNTSPAWDGSTADPQGDTVKCNNCHGFLNGSANTITSGKHLTHVKNLSMPCYYCHSDTAASDGTISNKTNHVNAAYDIKGGGDWYGTPIVLDKNIASGTGNWNATTKNCTVICHNYERNWTATDTGTCPDVCVGDALLNDDPKSVSFTAEQISSNTVRFTSVATDADRNDPVKAQCRGGGHAGQPGQLRIQRTSGGKLVAVPKFDGQPMINDWVLSDSSQIDNSNPAAPVFWYHRVYIDNDPASLNNLDPLKTYKNPALAPNDGLIYGETDGIAWSNAFQSVSWNPNFDDSQVNVLATPSVTTNVQNLGGGSYSLTLTSNIIDPDCFDLTKNTLFGGHGHDKTVKTRVKAYWGGGTTFTVHRGQCTDNSTPVTMETAMTYTFTGKTTGSQLWYYVQVFDSHREDPTANAASPSPSGESGWFFVTAP